MGIKHDTQTTSLERRLTLLATKLELTSEIENSQNICEAKTRTLHTLANEIDTRTTALENKPRFAAEIRQLLRGYTMPVGHITGFTELVDIGSNFDPQTGRLTIKDEGMYTLIVSALKHKENPENGSNMNGVVTLHLQKGDEVKLYNDYDES